MPAAGDRRPEPPPVADDRVVERDERVEDDRPPPRDPAGGAHVEVPRVTDHHDVGVLLVSPGEVPLRPQDARELPEAERPVVPLPHLAVELEHLDARAAQARDDLRVPG